MLFRILVAMAIALGCLAAPVWAQEKAQEKTQEQSFSAFIAKLWPEAQAKGITRANFDLALHGLTPDLRVIAATKRQPEYG